MLSAVSGAPCACARRSVSGLRRSAGTPLKEMPTTGKPSNERAGSCSGPGLREACGFAVAEAFWPVSGAAASAWHRAEICAPAKQKTIDVKTAGAKTAGRRNWRRECNASRMQRSRDVERYCRADECPMASTRTPRTARRRGPHGTPHLTTGFSSKTISYDVRWNLSIPAQTGSGSTRALEGRRLGSFYANSANLNCLTLY